MKKSNHFQTSFILKNFVIFYPERGLHRRSINNMKICLTFLFQIVWMSSNVNGKLWLHETPCAIWRISRTNFNKII